MDHGGLGLAARRRLARHAANLDCLGQPASCGGSLDTRSVTNKVAERVIRTVFSRV
jgi:hypothetical protein